MSPCPDIFGGWHTSEVRSTCVVLKLKKLDVCALRWAFEVGSFFRQKEEKRAQKKSESTWKTKKHISWTSGRRVWTQKIKSLGCHFLTTMWAIHALPLICRHDLYVVSVRMCFNESVNLLFFVWFFRHPPFYQLFVLSTLQACFFAKKILFDESIASRRVDGHGGPAAVRCGDLPLENSDAIAPRAARSDEMRWNLRGKRFFQRYKVMKLGKYKGSEIEIIRNSMIGNGKGIVITCI